MQTPHEAKSFPPVLEIPAQKAKQTASGRGNVKPQGLPLRATLRLSPAAGSQVGPGTGSPEAPGSYTVWVPMSLGEGNPASDH